RLGQGHLRRREPGIGGGGGADLRGLRGLQGVLPGGGRGLPLLLGRGHVHGLGILAVGGGDRGGVRGLRRRYFLRGAGRGGQVGRRDRAERGEPGAGRRERGGQAARGDDQPGQRGLEDAGGQVDPGERLLE